MIQANTKQTVETVNQSHWVKTTPKYFLSLATIFAKSFIKKTIFDIILLALLRCGTSIGKSVGYAYFENNLSHSKGGMCIN